MTLFSTRTVACLCMLLIALPAFASGDEDFKKDVNKTIRMIGFTPNSSSLNMATETEGNDDCSNPDPADIFADVVDGAIDVAGDEDWFVFQGAAGECLTFATDSRNGSGTDTQLYIYDAAGCTDPSAFIEFNDDGGPGLFSLISEWEVPADGTYYLRVKHFSSFGTGEYALSAARAACPTPPANDLCENAEPAQCNSTVLGTTTNAGNDLEDLLEICVPFGADGPDVFYEVVVADGDQIDVTLTPTDWDPALWIVTDCGDENSCLVGADDGFFNDQEQVSWVNDTGSDQTVYVVPDGYFSGAFGDFELSISCDQAVSNDDASWGAVKSRF